MPTSRTYDVVLFGATGFTGALTAEYLARHAPPGTSWALAGRSKEKLARLRDELAVLNPACADLPLLHADVGDTESVRTLAAQTKVVITTVGPYTHFGEPLVAACARAGTDYVDLCGEPEFVDLMYLRHHETARASGARLVHACGFDSIPYDLGAYFTVKRLPRDVPITLEGQVRGGMSASGGTFQSAVTAFSRPLGTVRAARERGRTQERPQGRRVRAVLGTPHRDRATGRWLVPAPTLDPQIVARSAAASDEYGTEFTYRHFLAVERLPILAAGAVGMAGLFTAAQVPPLRKRLLAMRPPGAGPDSAKRAQSWFAVRLTGEGGGQKVITEVAGGDPGYGETSKMLAESALCLATDDLPSTSGQVTTATAMGDALISRLVDAGLTFRALA